VSTDAVDVIAPFARTLDQELVALLRGASLECVVCGEFVMHARANAVFCPECGSQLAAADAVADDLRGFMPAG
jgi:Zn finger protein HypA/HybF involved in hydrogenase expression